MSTAAIASVAILEDAVTSSNREEARFVGLGVPGRDVDWVPGGTGSDRLVNCLRRLMSRAAENAEPLRGTVVVLVGGQCHGADPATTKHFPPSPVGTVRMLLPDADVREVTVSHACASTGIALGLAADLCRGGVCDAAIICATSMEGGIEQNAFTEARALGTALRPFDETADGTMVHGFAGALLVRPRDRTREDDVVLAGWHARSVGGRSGSDPAEELLVMNRAAHAAGVTPRVVLAHGTGTLQGDKAELDAVTAFSEQHDTDLLVVGNKGALGHAVFGAGVASAATALRLMEGASISGTVGLTTPRTSSERVRLVPEGGLDGQGFRLQGQSLLLNCFGFGGSNASIILERSTA